MSAIIKIRRMCPGEEAVVSALVASTFQRDVAPLYAQEGIQEFLSYATPSALQDRQARNHVVLLASQDESIVGMLALRDYCHVSMLFLEATHQRQGIGRLLLNEALRLIRVHNPEAREVTVNSSPNAVEAYMHLGFHVRGELQVRNGIGFVPMSLLLGASNRA